MYKKISFLLALLAVGALFSCNKPLHNTPYKIITIQNFESKYILKRTVQIYLPPNYDSSQRYAVIYMHDGQNVFDTATATVKVTWGIIEAMDTLLKQQKIRPAIVVAIANSRHRSAEYMPQKAVDTLTDKTTIGYPTYQFADTVVSDNYLKFITTELKPYIDSHYATHADAKNTFIMGASRGGLISLYAVCEYPDVFGGAVCISTHWPAAKGITVRYLQKHLPPPGKNLWYFDYGTKTLDSLYEPYQLQADSVMLHAGYVQNKDWITRKFEGEEHSERAWRKRVHIPLEFFLKK